MNVCRSEALSNKDRITGFVQFMFESLERCDRVGVEVDRSCGAVLRLCEVDGAAVDVNLPPSEGVLLR